MEQMMKGIALRGIVDIVREMAGPIGVEKLKSAAGEVTFSSSQKYPATLAANLVKQAANIIFGNNNPESEIELGKITSKKFTNMAIGKTMFALMGNNPKIIISSIAKIVGTGIDGFNIRTEVVGASTIKITAIDDPFPVNHSIGMFAGILEQLGKTPVISNKSLDDHTYELLVSWTE